MTTPAPLTSDGVGDGFLLAMADFYLWAADFFGTSRYVDMAYELMDLAEK